jgi:serine/alanine adding enzyme
MHYELLSYDDLHHVEKWRYLCQKLNLCDIYFFPEYAYLLEMHGDGKAHCFVYHETEEDFVIYPFLQRPINNIPFYADFPENLYDIITPYGYGGYLRSNAKVDMNKFYDNFKKYCKQNGIVSEFVRFHPLIKNYLYCPDAVDIQHWNDTVIIDLTLDENIIWKSIKESRRNKINKSKKNNINIIIEKNNDHLDDFFQCYIDTMERVSAYDYYSFSKEWFCQVCNLLENNFVVFHALWKNTIIASSIFIFYEPFFSTFLGGTSKNMLSLGSYNLLIYEAARWAKSNNFHYHHLGGGLIANDSLFNFKAAYSPLRGQYYIAKVIHLEEIYRFLCDRWVAAHPGKEAQSNFFPLYRSP